MTLGPRLAVADAGGSVTSVDEVDARGLGLRPVAAEAVLLGEGSDGVRAGVGLGGRGRGDRGERAREHEPHDTRTAQPVPHHPAVSPGALGAENRNLSGFVVLGSGGSPLRRSAGCPQVSRRPT